MDPSMKTSPADPRRADLGPTVCIKEGWALVEGNYGTALCGILLFVLCSFIPYGSVVLVGPAMCGMGYLFMKWMRGEAATTGAMFKGFEWMWESFATTLLKIALSTAVTMVPIGFALAMLLRLYGDTITGNTAAGPASPPATGFTLLMGGLGLYVVIVLLSLLVRTLFAMSYLLIVDRGLPPLAAVTTSFRAARANLFGLFFLELLNSLILGFGALLCLVPALLYAPIALASYAAAYARIFGLAEEPSFRGFEERDGARTEGRAPPVQPGDWTPLSVADGTPPTSP